MPVLWRMIFDAMQEKREKEDALRREAALQRQSQEAQREPEPQAKPEDIRPAPLPPLPPEPTERRMQPRPKKRLWAGLESPTPRFDRDGGEG